MGSLVIGKHGACANSLGSPCLRQLPTMHRPPPLNTFKNYLNTETCGKEIDMWAPTNVSEAMTVYTPCVSDVMVLTVFSPEDSVCPL